MAKMLGRKTRVCDTKTCTCNSHVRGKKAKRTTKRRERQNWKREI